MFARDPFVVNFYKNSASKKIVFCSQFCNRTGTISESMVNPSSPGPERAHKKRQRNQDLRIFFDFSCMRALFQIVILGLIRNNDLISYELLSGNLGPVRRIQ